jgi:hypothetical protein
MEPPTWQPTAADASPQHAIQVEADMDEPEIEL